MSMSRFIDKYGTHVVVGVKMGGKDVIHIKQLQNSTLQPTEVQKLLKQLADQRFSEDGGTDSDISSRKSKVFGRLESVPYKCIQKPSIFYMEVDCGVLNEFPACRLNNP